MILKQAEFDFSNPGKPDSSRPAEQPGHSIESRNESFDAALPKFPNQRTRILELLKRDDHYTRGLTRDEISRILELPIQSVTGRCNELIDPVRYRDGITPVYESKAERPTSNGGSAVVLFARNQDKVFFA